MWTHACGFTVVLTLQVVAYGHAWKHEGSSSLVVVVLNLLLLGWDRVHLVLWPLLAYCTSPRWWWWLWRNLWNENWQGKQKNSEKTCPSATLSTMTRPGSPWWEAYGTAIFLSYYMIFPAQSQVADWPSSPLCSSLSKMRSSTFVTWPKRTN
jgi:hypothetical protein